MKLTTRQIEICLNALDLLTPQVIKGDTDIEMSEVLFLQGSLHMAKAANLDKRVTHSFAEAELYFEKGEQG